MNYKIIVGLGNPGLKYKYTRHNIGFMFIDSLKKDFNLDFHLDKNLKCMIAENIIDINNEKIKVLFVKPITFMNNSGECVEKVMNYYKTNIDDLLVIHDDLDLPVAKVRIRPHGSSGGQKGMQNIIDHLKTSDIKRIRIGIDKDGDTIDYVLSKFPKADKEKIDNVLYQSKQMVMDFLTMKFENFMNEYNRNE